MFIICDANGLHRDDAILQTRKLQSAIVAEREKVDKLMR